MSAVAGQGGRTWRAAAPALTRVLGSVRRRRAALAAAAQISPALAVMLGGFLIPAGFFFVYSFWQLRDYRIVPAWTTGNYTNAFSSGVYGQVMLTTFEISALTALATTTVACALSSILRFQLRRWQNQILFFILLAMFSGYIVRIFAWWTILGNQGVINTLLLDLHLIHQPLSFLLYTRFATILVLSNFLIPLAILPCHAALQNVTDEQIEAARDLGCGAWKSYWRVTFPIAWPGIFLAFALSAIVASGDYLTPELVGPPNGIMVGQDIADIFLNQFDWPQGAALAFITLGAVLISVGSLRYLTSRVIK
jgi:spermidine/putrescine transport system permease protein